MAPTNRSRVATDITPQVASAGSRAALPATSWKSSVPKWVKMRSMPRMKAKSPTRLTTKAFLPASMADCFLYQKPISR